jgi:hypothetical protein
MKRKQYCCDASREMYEQYYMDQSGSGMPVFYGALGQRGHGLGSFLSGLFRRAMPFLTRSAKSFGKRALQTGLNVANDMVEGSSFQDSASRRIPEGLKGFVASNFGQSGSGKRRQRIRHIKSKKTKKRKKDIFG